MTVFFLLAFAHALADYPLQSDFLSRGKNPNTPIDGMSWQQLLFAHSLIQSGMVLLITSNIFLAIAELIIHFATDYAKCQKRITFNQDQAIHYGCKFIWAIAVIWLRHSHPAIY